MLSILLMSGYLGTMSNLIKVYCFKKCSKSKLCRVKASENCLCHVCEKSVGGMIGSEACLDGKE